ncbi:MAG: 2-amino-4-hydroxy-6-hydroxymethyldihydropteridine diphosphokinase [Vicinamibacterales bacterium]
MALGSNLGDRAAHLAFGVGRLATILHHLKQSSWFDTAPVGVGDQPRFLNGVVIGETALPARALLDLLLDFEREAGRERPFPGAPRPLDLDLIFYGEEQISEAGLIVPHPRFRERLFVLEPLAELAPTWVDPVSGAAVSALLLARRARRPS